MLRAAPAAATPPRAVFVKVGDGPYVDFDPPTGTDVMAMRKGKLIETIADSKRFAKSTDGMAQDQCTVSVVTSTATVQPTAEELAQSRVLEGMQTLGESVGTAKAEEGSIWVHIQPSARAATKSESL